MKPVDKKDLPKLIAIIVLAVGVFGWVMFPLLAPKPKPAAAQTEKPQTEEETAAAAAAAAEAAKKEAAFDIKSVSFLAGGKDPFTPNGPAVPLDAEAAAVTPAPAPAPAPFKPADIKPLPEQAKLWKGLGLPTKMSKGPSIYDQIDAQDNINRNPGGGGGGVAPVVVAPPPAPTPPAYAVTGIVTGDASSPDSRDVAILRGAGDERRFVSEGDSVGNGFVVTAVTPRGVEIKNGSHRATLTIGKAEEKSRAK